jgi:hypothetical protein
MKTIGIIGSRRRDTKEDLEKVINAFVKIYEPGDQICSGGCKKGGDRFAEIIAEAMGIPLVIHLPDKNKLNPILLEKAPRAAYREINYARNTLVAMDSNPIIACVAPDRKGGTEDTIKKFIKFHGKENLILV